MKGIQLSWPALVIGAIMLVAIGVGAAYLLLPRPAPTADARPMPSAPAAPTSSTGPLPDVEITLSEEAEKRSGILVSPVTTSNTTSGLRVPGVVEANAYKQVVVSPLATGRVTQVRVILGQSVAKGAPLVDIHSPDLAGAQTRYLSMRAEFQAVEQEMARTTRLVEIGAASKQELERIHAEHVSHRTEVDSARARLELLGMTPPQIAQLASRGDVAATTTVASPISGVVTERAVNPGTAVDAASPLVTVVDLSTVWVVGDLYERDFSAVTVGTPAIVTTAALPDVTIAGKVAYIDPQVRNETRTARIRIEVPNPGRRLRLGMYADIEISSPGRASQILIPRAAVQNVADRTVVYLKDPKTSGRFIEREVRLGSSSGDDVVVSFGLAPGDAIVSAGSFSLRAERERLGLRAVP